MRARVSLLACLAVTVVAMAVPASASAQRQEGLVNVNVSDNVVQVPIGVAANVCGVSAAVLAQMVTGPVDCTTTVDTNAVSASPGGGGGNARQEGLINLNIEDNVLQVPIGVAANICGVGVGVLSQQVILPVTCEARTRPRAQNN
jgi:hypothetical protein